LGKNLLITLGENIRYYRKIQRMTQEDFAKKLQVEQSYISQIEKGKKNLSILQLQDISEILEIPLTHLIEEREDHQFKTKAIKILENAIKELHKL